MAQLKDLIVNGASRFIGDSFVNQIQINSLKAKANSTTTIYSQGENDQLLTSNGNNVYWQTPPFVHRAGDTMTGDLNLVVSDDDPTPAINFIRENPNGNNDSYKDWKISNTANGIFSIASRITANGGWADRAWFEVSSDNTTGTFFVDNIKLLHTPTSTSGLNYAGAFLPIIMATSNIQAINSTNNIGELKVVIPNLVTTWTNGDTNGPSIEVKLNGLSASATAPTATTEHSGIITTTAQYFKGIKRFRESISVGYLDAAAGTTSGTFVEATGNMYLSGSAPRIVFKHKNISTTSTKIETTTSDSIHITPRLLIGTAATAYNQTPNYTTSAAYACVINNGTDRGLYVNNQVDVAGKIASFSNISTGSQTFFTAHNSGTQLFHLTYNYSSTVIQAAIGSGTSGIKGALILYDDLNYSTSFVGANNSTYGGNYIKTGVLVGNKIWGAVWNDYAEFRETKNKVEPGRCIVETGEGDLILSTERLQNGAEIVSDTYGFAIGQTEKCNTPIASNGRVLAYLYEDITTAKQNIGQPVCSGPNGTVSIMTDQEARDYPWKIIGTISEIPNYDKWQIGNFEDNQFINVDGRIWIRIR